MKKHVSITLGLSMFLTGTCAKGLAPSTRSVSYDSTSEHSSSTRDPYDSLIGSYRQPSELCTISEGDGNCAKQVEDCLSLREVSINKYRVNLTSVQANQHLCSFSIEMSVVEGSLVYLDESGGEIELSIDRERFVFQAKDLNPADPAIGFCGPHASLNDVKINIDALHHTNGECSSPRV